MRKLLLVVSLLVLASCGDLKTHGKFITEQKDAWMDGYGPGGHPYYEEIDRESKADKGLVFCRANTKENGTAAPVCYKPKFE